MLLVVAAVIVAAGLWLGLGVLTAVGQHRRGGHLVLVLLVLLLWPLAWVGWYARDHWSSPARA